MTEKNSYQLDIEEIKRFLPHRAPFLMVDRVLGIEPQGDLAEMSSKGKEGVKVTALKNVTYNEPFFQGHFPSMPIMPGVMILEAMAQCSSFSIYPYMLGRPGGIREGFKCILAGMDNVRYRKPVVPGDTLILKSVVKKTRGQLWSFATTAEVNGEMVAEADILAQLIPSGG